jgi:hypothetical protein
LDAYLAEKRAYQDDITKYVEENGCDNLPHNKLSALLSGNLLRSTGSKELLRWRWRQYVKGKPVLRCKDYLKVCDLPNYLRVKPEPRVGFLGIPLNVWEYHVFPFMDDLTLWNVMLTSRQLQARAHTTLMSRARQLFGPRATVMALHYWMTTLNNPRSLIVSYGAVDFYRKYDRFVAEQRLLQKKDQEMEHIFIQKVVNAINAVTPPELQLCIARQRQIQFERYQLETLPLYWFQGYKYLRTCRNLANANIVNPDKIRKRLEPHIPDELFLCIIRHIPLIRFLDHYWQSGYTYMRQILEYKGSEWCKHYRFVDATTSFGTRPYYALIGINTIVMKTGTLPSKVTNYEFIEELRAFIYVGGESEKKLKCQEGL